MTTRIKLRRDTEANWTTNDPVLALGEAGHNTNRFYNYNKDLHF
jgi:hypothetical protein